MVIDAENHTVRGYDAGRLKFTVYSGDGEISLDAIAPGFLASISLFFP